MVSDDVPIGHHTDAVGGEPDRDHLIGPMGRYAVAIPVSRHQALGTDATQIIDMPVETGSDWNQVALLFSKTICDGAGSLCWVSPSSQF